MHSCALLGLQLEHWAAESVRGVLACGSGGGEVLFPSLSLILSLNPPLTLTLTLTLTYSNLTLTET